MFFFSEIFVSGRRRGRLVSWVEKSSLKRIKRLLDITEGERNHELLLSVKNLRELSASPFPYIVLVIPRPLPTEFVRSKHFTLADLLKSISYSSAQARSTQEPQAETTQETSATFLRLGQSPLDEQNSRPTPRRQRRRRRARS